MGLTPIFPTEAIHRPTAEMGLKYAPMKDRATQMGIKHITHIINKPAERGYKHTTRVSNTNKRWHKKAHEVPQTKLPTLRVLSYIHNILRAELENM